MARPTDINIQAWIKLLRAHNTALAAVEGALKRADFPPLGWYDVLLELERAGAAGLRPFELEAELLLPQYSVSRVVDRIEKAGYLRRESCAEDGRGHRLAITAEGRTLRKKMWPVYRRAVADAIGAALSPGEAKSLAVLLAKLVG